MTLPSLATIDDLEDRLGRAITEPELTQAQKLLDYASALVRAYTGRSYVDDAGDLVDPLPDGVTQVTIEVVFRAISNPLGATTSQTGPFSVSFGPEAAQRLYLSAGDKLILGGRSGLTILSTTRGPVETPSVGATWPEWDGD